MTFSVTKLSANMKTTSFTASDTWTKDPRTQSIDVYGYDGGGGGGSGRKGLTTAAGGGAGGSGGRSFVLLGIPGYCCNSTETVTIGGGGTGGLTVTADTTNGNPGGSATLTAFGNTSNGVGGGVGVGGGGINGAATSVSFSAPHLTLSGANSSYLSTAWNTVAGTGGNGNLAAGSTSTAQLFTSAVYPTGGGGGGGANAVTGRAGGVGQSVAGVISGTLVTGGTSGAADNAGGQGADAQTTGSVPIPGLGGGGGGGQLTIGAGLKGGQGGQGGFPGGGGGGGGGGLNTTDATGGSGAGGNGGNGQVIVIEYF